MQIFIPLLCVRLRGFSVDDCWSTVCDENHGISLKTVLRSVYYFFHLHFYEREYKNYMKASKAFVLHGSEYTLNV
ncbi:hypothetical protein T12_10262 [Trichinella patagoniensis]|uniref:Uncharacterized protein n=1 Tax=Trichinella patagoniensis TaxID=990121 RepID=A0A0V0ZQ15_9BILA|nr:hypothetical protein T12_10262 [Trichinella patagoniensis]